MTDTSIPVSPLQPLPASTIATIFTYELDRLRNLPGVLDELHACPRGVRIDVHLTAGEVTTVEVNFQIRHPDGMSRIALERVGHAWEAVRPVVLEHIRHLGDSWLPAMHVLLARDMARSDVVAHLSFAEVRRILQETLAACLVELAFQRLEDGMRGRGRGKN